MSINSPPSLFDVAILSLLRDDTSAIAALECLPINLFPPLFKVAITGGHFKTVTAMVGAWPFHFLALGSLLVAEEPHQEILKAALDGLDVLFGQKVRPRRWRLQVLDLRKKIDTSSWNAGSGTLVRSSVYFAEEPVYAQLRQRRQNMEHSKLGEKQPIVSVQVLIDMRIRKCDEFLTFLIERVRQRKGLMRLCCKNLAFVDMPSQISLIENILQAVQLDFIQILTINCTWDLFILARIAPYLGCMFKLRRLILCRITTRFFNSEAEDREVETSLAQFAAQFFHLHQLKELLLLSVHCLEGHLDQVLSCLASPLETLWITDCLISDSDLTYLTVCSNTSQLNSFHLRDVVLTNVNPELLQSLLMRASTTLHFLDWSGCGITDSQLTSILPSLGHCSQLQFFKFSGSLVSMTVLERLLRYTLPLCNFQCLELPVPVECYVENTGILHQDTLELHMDKIRQILQELERCSQDVKSCYHSSIAYDSIVLNF
ncbi:melanoma antigen preferentially expressed in tumors-like [Echinops telfairi]|uniref:Melanoma antigen preferentially expressed in tumors-like n=1 Tax=Echinops telfairi TaxID=9371 RepID=A0AC55CQ10_ECHTE|nr:melanoma antigen preferentially expressed in tumors-like [Echinops telfairi]